MPFGVRLVQPFWLRWVDGFEVVTVAGPLGTTAAVVGFPGVGTGIAIACGVVCLPMLIAEWLMRTDLTFEPAGLRVHKRGLRFFISWPSIVGVAVVPAANPPLSVEIAEPVRLLATIDPDTPRNRRRVEIELAVGGSSGRSLQFQNWTGGLDSPTLSRAIRETMGKPRDAPN